MSADPGTDDDDLMDLASRHAYNNELTPDPERPKWNSVMVNGKQFEVVDVHEDRSTGLNATTFRNAETGEITVAFQGSSGGTDWQNNGVLITSMTPEQFEAAEAYVASIGGVDFVCGNSLGGGLAAYVAALHPGIRAVTVNPAPVPASLAGADAPNVRNFLTSNDMLHQLVVAGGLADRIIGEQITVPGTATNDVFGDNHIGADRGDLSDPDDDAQHVYDASMSTPFSLFHDGVVLTAGGGHGSRVDITLTALTLMAERLHRQHTDLLAVIEAELGTLDADLAEHAATLDAREQQAHDVISEVFQGGYETVRRQVGEARATLERLYPILRRLPVPGPMSVVWTPIADLLTKTLDAALAGLIELVELAADRAAEVVWRAECAVFVDLSQAITEGLREQHTELGADIELIDDRWQAFTAICRAVVRELARADAEVAAAIASRRCPSDALPTIAITWPPARARGVTEDLTQRMAQTITSLCEDGASSQLSLVAAGLADVLIPPTATLAGVEVAIAALETTIDGALVTVDRACAPAQTLGALVGLDDDVERFREDVRDLRHDLDRHLDEARDLLRAARTTLDELPGLVLSTHRQIESLICPDQQIQTAYDAFSTVRNLVERSTIAFDEVGYQLIEHDASTIHALADRAHELREDLITTEDALAEIVA